MLLFSTSFEVPFALAYIAGGGAGIGGVGERGEGEGWISALPQFSAIFRNSSEEFPWNSAEFRNCPRLSDFLMRSRLRTLQDLQSTWRLSGSVG